jgi:type I restriction enzyme M protein
VAGRCVPYESYGNGAGMRISPVGWVADSEEEVKYLSRVLTEISHNHLEGIKGAEAVAVAVYLAKSGESMLDIQEYITKNYYDITFKLDDIRAGYNFDVTCQGSVPQALEAFFESVSFEDAIRNAISIGGDSDTLAAITGAVAEAYYGVPAHIRKCACTFLDARLLKILLEFETRYPAQRDRV